MTKMICQITTNSSLRILNGSLAPSLNVGVILMEQKLIQNPPQKVKK